MRRVFIIIASIPLILPVGCAWVPASIHYTHGTQALERGDYHRAVDELEQAVRLDPHMARNHNNLAAAYGRLGNDSAAWFHIRQAVLIDPGHGNAMLNFERYWSSFVGSGRVAIGKPSSEVIAVLGEPDASISSDKESVLIWGARMVTVRDQVVTAIEIVRK